MKIGIYGIGSFGYALLKYLDVHSSDKTEIYAYDRSQTIRNYIQKHKEHKKVHRGKKITKRIKIAYNEEELIRNCNILIFAITSNATREVLTRCKPLIAREKEIIIVNTAKALDYETGKPLSVTTKQVLSPLKNYHYVVISGGTMAKDLFEQEPLGMDIASKNVKALKKVKKILESDTLHIYESNDVLGVEYAGAFKNVVSIISGIVHGIGFSYGAETHIISKAGEEISELVVNKLGGKKQTFSIGSQSWGNDLWMSCLGNTRNRAYGVLIGKGKITNHETKTIEGINTLHAITKLIRLETYPYIDAAHKIIILQKDPKSVIKSLFKHKKI